MSELHAEIRLDKGRFYLHDLANSAGTIVNGSPVTAHQLADRDEIHIADTIMLYVQAATAEELNAEAKERLKQFDSMWNQLTEAARHG